MSEILDFYSGKETSCAHNLNDIWFFSLDELESNHDYIQWMFPLNEPSSYNLEAPILTDEDIKAFKESSILQKNLKISVHVFMIFLHVTSDTWLCEKDHNHLRITRMLKCLMLLGLRDKAIAQLRELTALIECSRMFLDNPNFMSIPLKFWNDAVFE